MQRSFGVPNTSSQDPAYGCNDVRKLNRQHDCPYLRSILGPLNKLNDVVRVPAQFGEPIASSRASRKIQPEDAATTMSRFAVTLLDSVSRTPIIFPGPFWMVEPLPH